MTARAPLTLVELTNLQIVVAHAVADLNRPGLPSFSSITTTRLRHVWAQFPGIEMDVVESVARWAHAHGQPVELNLDGGLGKVRASIPAPFGELELEETVTARRVYELGARLCLPVQDRNTVEVDPAELLGELASEVTR